MPRSYWIAAIAVGLSLGLTPPGSAQSSEQPEQNQPERDRQDDAGQNGAAPSGIPVRILEEPEQSEDAKRLEKEAADREKNDLVAQQSMADSTRQIVKLTIAQFILAFFGTFALFYTLYLNWKSTDAAVRASHSDRAWMAFHKFETPELHHANVNGQMAINGLGVTAIWKNVGKTPSIDTHCVSDHWLLSPGEDIPLFQPATASEASTGKTVIGPDGSFAGITRALGDVDAVAVRSGGKRMIVYSRVDYLDIYKIGHHTEVCMEMEFQGMKIVNGVPRPHIVFKPVGPQNTAT